MIPVVGSLCQTDLVSLENIRRIKHIWFIFIFHRQCWNEREHQRQAQKQLSHNRSFLWSSRFSCRVPLKGLRNETFKFFFLHFFFFKWWLFYLLFQLFFNSDQTVPQLLPARCKVSAAAAASWKPNQWLHKVALVVRKSWVVPGGWVPADRINLVKLIRFSQINPISCFFYI